MFTSLGNYHHPFFPCFALNCDIWEGGELRMTIGEVHLYSNLVLLLGLDCELSLTSNPEQQDL